MPPPSPFFLEIDGWESSNLFYTALIMTTNAYSSLQASIPGDRVGRDGENLEKLYNGNYCT